MKNNKGITMISLVVTIIILIILAGVSLNLVLGENGIITMSKQAKEKTEQAKLNEEIALNELYMQIEAEGGDGSNIYIEKLAEFKKEIADYIEEAGGIKPEYTADTITFGDSIKGIVKEVTKNATATADDIANGKTAWVNGEKIVGTSKNELEKIIIANYDGLGKTDPIYQTIDVKSKYKNYTSLTNDNFALVIRGLWNSRSASSGDAIYPTLSYNSTTGIVTIGPMRSGGGNVVCSAYSVYLYI